jgi:hypothetical protein
MGHLQQIRQRLAVESARLMSEEGIDDFQYARKKAAQHFGIQDSYAYPSNEEIITEIKLHQAIYGSADQAHILRELRNTALNAMKLFKDFIPKLTGSVLSGYAGKNSRINIHLFADTAEDITMILLQHDIPYQLTETRLNFNKKISKVFPKFQFFAGDFQVNLTVIPNKQKHNHPVNTFDGQSMQRASIKQLEKLLFN